MLGVVEGGSIGENRIISTPIDYRVWDVPVVTGITGGTPHESLWHMGLPVAYGTPCGIWGSLWHIGLPCHVGSVSQVIVKLSPFNQ